MSWGLDKVVTKVKDKAQSLVSGDHMRTKEYKGNILSLEIHALENLL
jgi:hypothetical protein